MIILKLIPNKKGIISIILFLILFPLCFRIYHSGITVDEFWLDVRFRKVVLMRLYTVIYGVLAAYIKFYHSSIWKRFALVSFIIGLLGLVLIPNIPMEPNTFFSKTFYFSLTSIAAMLIIPFADNIKHFKWKTGKYITHISLISYSMYLINLGLGTHIIKANFPIENPQDGVIKYILFWVYLIASSTLLYYFFEKPMTSLRDKPLRALFKK
jgi:peptidoglycan/LPS O-acetylase OafA/YrhL